jgi:hypothetical protein
MSSAAPTTSSVLLAVLILLIVFSAVYSGIYFVVRKRPKTYGVILAVAMATTTLLFIYDSIYDDIPPGYTWRTHVFESVVYGSVYTAIIFGLLSQMYFGISKLPD